MPRRTKTPRPTSRMAIEPELLSPELVGTAVPASFETTWTFLILSTFKPSSWLHSSELLPVIASTPCRLVGSVGSSAEAIASVMLTTMTDPAPLSVPADSSSAFIGIRRRCLWPDEASAPRFWSVTCTRERVTFATSASLRRSPSFFSLNSACVMC